MENQIRHERAKQLKYIGIIVLLVFTFCELKGQKTNSKLETIFHSIPHLEKTGTTARLIVDDKPFLILGGELGNSSFTSVEYMKPIWPKLKAIHLNTVLAPVYWELIEPTEGKFDFNLYDQLIKEARKYDLKLVLLWFGSWKNSMSCYAPSWVKKDQTRFPRALDDKGTSQEILTLFSSDNLKADLKAYQTLLKHIKEFDSQDHTIIMIQTENEIGMLPVARDYSALANMQFNKNIPEELVQYLIKNKEYLVPEFKEKWAASGYKESGTWEEIFGKSTGTDEIFMAWHFAKFTNAVIEAGKSVYALPMFVNAALNRPGVLPGNYPSAGPLPHLMDIWKAAGPSVDFLSPDFYNPDFRKWCDLYTRQGNPLFIPEHVFNNTTAAKALFAIGHYEGIGFSPFAIEEAKDPENEPLGRIYNLIHQLTPLIATNQGMNKIDAVLLDKENKESVIHFGNYEFTVRHSYTLGYESNSKSETWDNTGALIIQTRNDEFYIAGFGVVITFRNLVKPEMEVGILKVDEGRIENNEWKVVRHLNGDQTHQGRHVRIMANEYSILRFELYNYE